MHGHLFSCIRLHLVCWALLHSACLWLVISNDFHPFPGCHSTNSLEFCLFDYVIYKRGYLRYDVLSVSEVESTEQRVVVRGRFAILILIQEDRWASELHTELLDSLFIINRQQKGLEAGLGAHCGQDGKVLRENMTCVAKRRGGERQVSGWRVEIKWPFKFVKLPQSRRIPVILNRDLQTPLSCMF